ncbi:uncharacterized protein LOC134842073 isoform X2 [Symsagittifera roscoffensis]|uniref:uncharacterized protein LOC134842073 isoform X2 n=1 Tax=Symsagittifera roscoffensis TaxID=84072 RepID=UPI00307C6541
MYLTNFFVGVFLFTCWTPRTFSSIVPLPDGNSPAQELLMFGDIQKDEKLGGENSSTGENSEMMPKTGASAAKNEDSFTTAHDVVSDNLSQGAGGGAGQSGSKGNRNIGGMADNMENAGAVAGNLQNMPEVDVAENEAGNNDTESLEESLNRTITGDSQVVEGEGEKGSSGEQTKNGDNDEDEDEEDEEDEDDDDEDEDDEDEDDEDEDDEEDQNSGNEGGGNNGNGDHDSEKNSNKTDEANSED